MIWFKNWLMGIVAAALAVSLAQAMTPEGPVRKVGRLVGGMVLLLAVGRPLLRLEPAMSAMAHIPGAEVSRVRIEEGGEEMMKTLIAQKAGAYIVDKGSALGCVCAAKVTVATDDTGWPVPWQVEVSGSMTAAQQQALARAIAEDLAIPAERQSFREEDV